MEDFDCLFDVCFFLSIGQMASLCLVNGQLNRWLRPWLDEGKRFRRKLNEVYIHEGLENNRIFNREGHEKNVPKPCGPPPPNVVGISKLSILWEKASATFFAQLDCFKPLLLASNCALNLQLVPINIGPSSSSQIPPFQRLTRNRRDLDRLFLDVFGQCKQLTFWQSHFNFNREFFEGHPFVNGLPVLKLHGPMDDGLMQFLARWLVNAPNGHGHGCKHLILLNAWINLELIRTFLESIEKQFLASGSAHPRTSLLHVRNFYKRNGMVDFGGQRKLANEKTEEILLIKLLGCNKSVEGARSWPYSNENLAYLIQRVPSNAKMEEEEGGALMGEEQIERMFPKPEIGCHIELGTNRI